MSVTVWAGPSGPRQQQQQQLNSPDRRSLGTNGIDPPGADALGKGLLRNTTLRDLRCVPHQAAHGGRADGCARSLSANPIGDRGAELLVEGLAKSSGLRVMECVGAGRPTGSADSCTGAV